jgi:hypothetical protein
MPTLVSIPLVSHVLKCGYLSFVTLMLLKCHASSILSNGTNAAISGKTA